MPSQSIARKNMKRSKLRKRTSRRTRINKRQNNRRRKLNKRQNTKRTRINKRQNTKRRRLTKRQNTRRKFNGGEGGKGRPRRGADPDVHLYPYDRSGVVLMKQEALMKERDKAHASYRGDRGGVKYIKSEIKRIPSLMKQFELIKGHTWWPHYISEQIKIPDPHKKTMVDWAKGLYYGNINEDFLKQFPTDEGAKIISYKDKSPVLTEWVEYKYGELFSAYAKPVRPHY